MNRIQLSYPSFIPPACPRIIEEANALWSVFEQHASESTKSDSPTEVMKSLAEVIKVADVEFLSFELHRILRRCGER